MSKAKRKTKPKSKPVSPGRLAHLIAIELFTTGGGIRELANRLVLEGNDGRLISGWSFRAARIAIEKTIKAANRSH